MEDYTMLSNEEYDKRYPDREDQKEELRKSYC